MSATQLALLVGLVVPPLLLLWLGHGYRTRSGPARALFWGGVLGYLAAGGVVSVAAMAPPIGWEEGGARAVVVHGVLLVGPLVGAALGGAVWRGRRG